MEQRKRPRDVPDSDDGDDGLKAHCDVGLDAGAEGNRHNGANCLEKGCQVSYQQRDG